MTIPTGISSASSREYVLRTDNVHIYYNEVDNLKNNKTMKRIYLFVLSALMMLMSTSAMAQSETVKGDVNGDGVVDVADIAAVIKIMTNNGDIEKKYYWYVGQEAVTSDNYTTLAESSSTKYTTKNYTTEKFGKVYILVPNIVKSIKIKDGNLNIYVSESAYKIDSTINISGYNVYVTSAFGAEAPVIIEYYY
jgi:hypothetical protein